MSLPRLAVNNRVVVDLLLVGTLIGGVYCGLTLTREMFPESRPTHISILTPYPGATPTEMEPVAERIEEAIRDIEQIEKVEATLNEGSCSILVELTSDVTDVDAKLNEFKNAVDSIPNDELPADVEETLIQKLEPRLPVISVTIYGDKDEHSLQDLGRSLRDEVLRLPGVTNVVLGGVRKSELTVELKPDKLVEYGTSLGAVSRAIRETNLDLPAGQLKTGPENIAIRTLGETDDADRIAQTIVKTAEGGRIVRVGDLGRVIDAFEDSDVIARFNGMPCADLTVYKTGRQDSIDIAQNVLAYVAGKRHLPLQLDWKARLYESLGGRSAARKVYEAAYNNPLPADLHIEVHSNLARYIEGRLDLLWRNSLQGLALVGATLLLFLNWRVALWAMVGVVFSVCGTAILMSVLGVSLNLISMFGLLIVLGILVDDAIIIGENIFARVESGENPRRAAILGTEEVQGPVTICVLTTIAAFLPLLFIEGQIGDFFGVLPIVAIFALATSLIEALTQLPAHLADWLKPNPRARKPGSFVWPGPLRHFQGIGHRLMEGVIGPTYDAVLRWIVGHRYVAAAGLVAVFITTLGLVLSVDRNGQISPGGRVPFVFLQKMDSETLLVNLEMPVGTPLETTSNALREVELAALDRTAFPDVRTVFSLVGMQIMADEGGVGANFRSHIAQAVIELHEVDHRDRSSDQVIAALRERVGLPPGTRSLRFAGMQGGPAGAEIEIEISSPRPDDIAAAADAIAKKLSSYTGVFDVDDNRDDGRRELQIRLLDSARSAGVSTQWLATEVRGAFYGLEARTLQRQDEDVDIRVRFPESDRNSVRVVEQLRITLPDGAVVPLSEIAQVEETRGYASLHRVDSRRAVTVTADVDQAATTADRVLADLSGLTTSLAGQTPGLQIEFTGRKLETRKSFGSLNRDFWIALGLIYVLIAILFKSYLQPLVVMAAVPFAIIGAIWGHWFMGFPLTFLSMIGIVALTGVAVNDGVVMVEFINNGIKAGKPVRDAVLNAGRRRLRAILLTSTTTVIGTAPIVLEQSFQARFLIPMVISISAGLMFCTVLTLLIVPAFYMILVDLKRLTARVTGMAIPDVPLVESLHSAPATS